MLTHDLPAARRFYQDLFGWTQAATTLERLGAYTVFKRGEELGGSPGFVHTIAKSGRIGGLQDPGGAWFTLRGPSSGAT